VSAQLLRRGGCSCFMQYEPEGSNAVTLIMLIMVRTQGWGHNLRGGGGLVHCWRLKAAARLLRRAVLCCADPRPLAQASCHGAILCHPL
jgi:hypothetical protein